MTTLRPAVPASLPGHSTVHAPFELDGIKICMTHASPRDPLYQYITPEITDRELESAEADIVLLGHSPLPMCRKIGGKTMASYAGVEDGKVELKRIEYDVGAAVERLFETYESSLAQELATPVCGHKT